METEGALSQGTLTSTLSARAAAAVDSTIVLYVNHNGLTSRDLSMHVEFYYAMRAVQHSCVYFRLHCQAREIVVMSDTNSNIKAVVQHVSELNCTDADEFRDWHAKLPIGVRLQNRAVFNVFRGHERPSITDKATAHAACETADATTSLSSLRTLQPSPLFVRLKGYVTMMTPKMGSMREVLYTKRSTIFIGKLFVRRISR